MRLPKLYEGDSKFSRKTNPTNKRERGVKQMNICQFCGWEVKKPEWYNSYDGGYACDDCLMDQAVEREKENAL